MPRVIPPQPAPDRRLGLPGRPLRRLLPLISALLLLALGAGFASADSLSGTTPTTPTTPATTPLAVAPLSGPATIAQITWTPPASLTEEQPSQLSLAGTLNGFATLHTLLQPQSAGACPASPLYPRQVATGTQLSVTATAPDPGGSGSIGPVQRTLTITPQNGGPQRLCAWIVASPSSSAASTVASLDQVYDVASAPATLVQTVPQATRAADFFTVQFSGTTSGTGRRVLVMGELDTGQQCGNLVKLAAGKRPLQTVATVAKGAFTKTLHLRFKVTTPPGNYLLCTQIVEANDRVPEAVQSGTIQVTDSGRCVQAKTAIAGRLQDTAAITKRRDQAKTRLAQIRAKLPALQHRGVAARKQYVARVHAAQRAARHARSKAGKHKARLRLVTVRRSQAALLRRKTAPLRLARSAERQRAHDYDQQRDGVTLLLGSVKRAQKSLKKYCG